MIYNRCLKNKIISEEQKGYTKSSFGCKEKLIDFIIMEQINVIFLVFIDYEEVLMIHCHVRGLLKFYKLIRFIRH
jgi:hypothetical protein